MSDSLGRLIALLHNRWGLLILAELDRQGGGSKFVTLVNRLGISRDSLTRTLRSLDGQGLVVRNPGYGHPLRPEYVLTREGKALAPWCARVLRVVRALGAEDVAGRKWSLAILLALAEGHERFSEIMSRLPGITARALAATLKTLDESGVIDRTIVDAHPPQVRYRLSRSGRRMAPVLTGGPLAGK